MQRDSDCWLRQAGTPEDGAIAFLTFQNRDNGSKGVFVIAGS